jgi:hypothetical protein
MTTTQLEVPDDAQAAGWLTDRLDDFARSVCSVVPAGFRAYVRIFHPAARFASDGSESTVRWEAIAAASGKQVHAAMQLPALTGIDMHAEELPGVFDSAPEIGTLPPSVAAPLVSTLSRHTATPERCWFALWDGYGGTPRRVRQAPTFHLPFRDYYLLTGPIEWATLDVLDGWQQSANLWWPDDHAWCVATEIDFNTSYVGCGEACRDEILTLTDVEAKTIEPSSGITLASDTVNTST